MRTTKNLAATLLAVLMLPVATSAVAGSPMGVCQAGGVNDVVLGDAMGQYFVWALTEDQPQEVGPLFFVPYPFGDPISEDPLIFQGSESFAVRSGRTLVFPLFVVVGESYVEGPPDDPVSDLIDFKASYLLLMVDGRVIVDSTRTKLDCVYIGLTYFEEPIVYAEPSSYGSDAAIWIEGLGIRLPPMSLGSHIIEMQVVTPTAALFGVDIGYYNTWYVTVERP